MTFATLFCLMLMGHLVGDYLLQNEWMAVNKSGKGWFAHLTCTVHVTLYTLSMITFLGTHRWNTGFFGAWIVAITLLFLCRFHKGYATLLTVGLLGLMAIGLTHPWLVLALAVPHWLIDRTGFANLFLKWKNGYLPKTILQPNEVRFAPMQVWQVAFAAPVYIVNDNSMHFLCMLPLLYWLAR